MNCIDAVVTNAFAMPSDASKYQEEIRDAMMASTFVPKIRVPSNRRDEEPMMFGLSRIQTDFINLFWMPKSMRFVPLTIADVARRSTIGSNSVRFHIKNLEDMKLLKSEIKDNITIIELTDFAKRIVRENTFDE